jgi:hypothetical protein
MRRMLTAISCPPQTGRELAPIDQAGPDPVVVASAGPLPSATLHEKYGCSEYKYGTTHDRLRLIRCQPEMFCPH